jgi:hypothetical protein
METYESYNSKTLLLSDRIDIDGWNGKKVPTDRKFLTFLNWFKNEIAITRARVINSTEGGALIGGALHMPLGEALKGCDPAPPLNKEVFIRTEDRNEEGFIILLGEFKTEINKLEELSKKAYQAANRALQKFKKMSAMSDEFNVMTKFDSTFIKISHEKSLIARFIELTMQGSIEKISSMSGDGVLNAETLEAWLSLYGEASEGLHYIGRLIDKRLRLQK